MVLADEWWNTLNPWWLSHLVAACPTIVLNSLFGLPSQHVLLQQCHCLIYQMSCSEISENLESERYINAIAQVNCRLYCLLDSYLYRYNIQQSGSSALLWAARHG